MATYYGTGTSCTNSTTNSTVMNYDTWNQWTTTGTGSLTLVDCSITTSSSTWIDWNDQRAITYPTYAAPIETPAEIVQRERRQAGVRVAREKADVLLRSLLNDEQIKMMEEENRFFVMGQSGKLYEVLTNKTQHNVFEIEPNGHKRLMEFCIVAPRVPTGDHLAAQVLMLKTEESEFYRQANVWALEGQFGPDGRTPSGRRSIYEAERQLYAA